MSAEPLLSLNRVDAYYGESHVLQQVSLSVSQGTVVALLGRNGAGKSTCLKTIMGIVRARAGSIEFAGRATRRLAPHHIARLGVGYVPEERAVFPSLTVEENLTLAAGVRAGAIAAQARAAGRLPAWTLERVYATFPRLAERRRNGGHALSGGEQQMLAIGRALMLNPSLLVLDEPTEGLAPVIVNEIAGIIDRLRRVGLTMLVVEQNYAFACAIADRAYVLGRGRVRWNGTPGALDADEEVKHTWLGV